MTRKVAQAARIVELRAMARRRLPGPVFDYLESGSDGETAASRDRRAFARWNFLPRRGSETFVPDLSVTVMGQRLRLPIVAAPMGLAGLFWPNADRLLARTCADAGALFTLSTFASASFEDLADIAQSGKCLFQLNPPADRGLAGDLLDRARSAGFSGLCLTLDNPGHGRRHTDRRQGMPGPLHWRSPLLRAALWHPRWALAMAGHPPRLANLEPYLAHFGGLEGLLSQFIRPCGWQEVRWLRDRWPGSFAIKGLLHPEDIDIACRLGADAVFVSGQGGRHFDASVSSLTMLPEAVDAAAGRCQIILDGGIREGADVARACALGASACATARPFGYGLAAGGLVGAARTFDILAEEMRHTLLFTGCDDIGSLNRDWLRAEHG